MSTTIDAAELCRISSPMELAVSPDGDRIAFTSIEWDQSNDERHTALYVVPTDGSRQPHRLSRGSAAGSPRWSPDGTRLGFIASRAEDYERRIGPADTDDDDDDGPTEANDEPKAQVWAFDLERGGDAIQLTERDWGVRGFDWSPDGERIVIDARDPTEEQVEYLERLDDDGPVEIERLQHRIDGVGFTDDVTSYLFVVDLETGDETRLDETAGTGAFEPFAGLQPRWSPTGDEIAFLNATADRPDDTTAREVHLVDPSDGSVEVVTELGMMLMQPEWSPDGGHIALGGRDAVNWYRPMDAIVVEADTGNSTVVSADIEATLSWFGFPQFIDEETVIAGFGDRGRTRLYRFTTAGDIAEPVSLGFDESSASLRTIDVGGETVAFVVTHPNEGIDVHATTTALDPAVTRQLTAMNASFIKERPLPSFTRIESTSDGESIESMVYHPDSFDPDDPEPHPTIIVPHGGPMSYDDPEFSFQFAYFTSRGYLIVKPNYRGSTSYGTEFAEVLLGRWGTVEVDDTLAVVDDLVERGWAHEERLFSMGFSYGGILTGYLITRTDRFAAVAPEHGIYDISAEFGTSDSHIWLGHEFGLPWEDPEVYEGASSLADIGGVDTPALITAGEEDWRCPPTQSEQLYVSLRKQGTPAKLVIYPGENHDVSAPGRAIHRFETIVEWFETHDPTVE